MPRNLRVVAGAHITHDAWRHRVAISIPLRDHQGVIVIENTTDRHFISIDRALLDVLSAHLKKAEGMAGARRAAVNAEVSEELAKHLVGA